MCTTTYLSQEGCTVDIGLALGRTLRLDILEVQPSSGPSR